MKRGFSFFDPYPPGPSVQCKKSKLHAFRFLAFKPFFPLIGIKHNSSILQFFEIEPVPCPVTSRTRKL